MLFGERAGENPAKRGVSVADVGPFFATYVFQECSVPGLLVPLPPFPLLGEAVIFLAMTLQRARCVLASAGTCG